MPQAASTLFLPFIVLALQAQSSPISVNPGKCWNTSSSHAPAHSLSEHVHRPADTNLITQLVDFPGCLKGLFPIPSLREQLQINHFNHSQETVPVWYFIKSWSTQLHLSSGVFSCGFRLHPSQSNGKCLPLPVVSVIPQAACLVPSHIIWAAKPTWSICSFCWWFLASLTPQTD